MNKDIAVSVLGQENKATLITKLVAKGFNFIHYDIMDGLFVPRHSLPQKEMEYILSHTPKHIVNLHLMVNDPLKYIQMYRHQADYITFHYEAESIDNIRKILRNYGQQLKLGIAISPQTNIEQIYEFIPDLSHLLIMSVHPGQGGQKFMPAALDKVTKIHEYIKRLKADCLIQIDGGINDQTGPAAFLAGVTNAVSGSYVLNNLSTKNLKARIMGQVK